MTAGEDIPGCVTVSTDNAVYLLHPGQHTETSRIDTDVIERVDAVVLENGTQPYDDVTVDWLEAQPQYRELVAQCRDTKTPIAVADAPYPGSSSWMYLSEVAELGLPCAAGILGLLHGYTALGALTVPAFAFAFGGAGHSERMNRLAGYLQLSGAYTWSGFRSAVTAEKLDSVVASQLAAESDIPPTILVEYGAGHLDIGSYLRHPWLRRQVINTHRRLSFQEREDTLEAVCLFQFADDTCEKQVAAATF